MNTSIRRPSEVAVLLGLRLRRFSPDTPFLFGGRCGFESRTMHDRQATDGSAVKHYITSIHLGSPGMNIRLEELWLKLYDDCGIVILYVVT